jgi:hypothetical protein
MILSSISLLSFCLFDKIFDFNYHLFDNYKLMRIINKHQLNKNQIKILY